MEKITIWWYSAWSTFLGACSPSSRGTIGKAGETWQNIVKWKTNVSIGPRNI